MNEVTLKEVKKIIEKRHHLFSPSSLFRRFLCPGSAALEAKIEEEITTVEGEEGTLLHEVIAERIHEKENSKYDSLTAEQKEQVNKCYNFFCELRKKMPEAEIFTEKKMRLIGDNYEVLTSGTADLIISDFEKTILVDWKFGRGQVENVESNLQLAAYAAMAMQLIGIPEIETHIFQPRINYHSQFTFHSKNNLTQTIQNIIDKANRADAECVAGETQCRYCKAIEFCPEIKKQALIIKRENEEIHTRDLALNELTKLYNACKFIANFYSRLEFRIKDYCLKNPIDDKNFGVIGNLTVQKKRGNRIIKDANKAYELASQKLTQDEFLQAITVSPSKLEGVFVEKYYQKAKEEGRKVTKKELKSAFEMLMHEVIEYGSDKISIVELPEAQVKYLQEKQEKQLEQAF